MSDDHKHEGPVTVKDIHNAIDLAKNTQLVIDTSNAVVGLLGKGEVESANNYLIGVKAAQDKARAIKWQLLQFEDNDHDSHGGEGYPGHEPTGVVQGIGLINNNRPALDATYSLVRDDQKVFSVNANVDKTSGKFTFTNVPFGTYAVRGVRGSAPGIQTQPNSPFTINENNLLQNVVVVFSETLLLKNPDGSAAQGLNAPQEKKPRATLKGDQNITVDRDKSSGWFSGKQHHIEGVIELANVNGKQYEHNLLLYNADGTYLGPVQHTTGGSKFIFKIDVNNTIIPDHPVLTKGNYWLLYIPRGEGIEPYTVPRTFPEQVPSYVLRILVQIKGLDPIITPPPQQPMQLGPGQTQSSLKAAGTTESLPPQGTPPASTTPSKEKTEPKEKIPAVITVQPAIDKSIDRTTTLRGNVSVTDDNKLFGESSWLFSVSSNIINKPVIYTIETYVTTGNGTVDVLNEQIRRSLGMRVLGQHKIDDAADAQRLNFTVTDQYAYATEPAIETGSIDTLDSIRTRTSRSTKEIMIKFGSDGQLSQRSGWDILSELYANQKGVDKLSIRLAAQGVKGADNQPLYEDGRQVMGLGTIEFIRPVSNVETISQEPESSTNVEEKSAAAKKGGRIKTKNKKRT